MNNIKNISHRVLTTLFYISTLIMATACGENQFRIQGDIADANDAPLYLERADFRGVWIPVDSTHTDDSGHFDIKCNASQHPEIYRLQLGNSYIYLPVDSTEHLTLTTTAADFGRKFKLDGSDQARAMTRFAEQCATATDATIPDLKKWVLGNIILPGHGDLMSYYVLTATFNGSPLFSVNDPADAAAYGAVATAYAQFHPNDPRTKLLKSMAMTARRTSIAARGAQKVVKAPETSMIDIALKNIEGKEVKLSSVMTNSRPTLVIFSLTSHAESPEITRKIGDLYHQYGSRINFYQVCLDEVISAWRETARNIPWTVVLDPEGLSSRIAAMYNVRSLPAFFIYNGRGELVSRADSFDELSKQLTSY